MVSGLVGMRVRLDQRWRGLRRVLPLFAVGLFAIAGILLFPPTSRAADCSLGDFGYNSFCGPEFESPGWGDAAGWSDPSQYSTIQLADITGNGQDELLARSNDGLEVWRFDTSIGQWRPAIGADGLPEVLTGFRSSLPDESADTHGADPMVYSTLQAAQVLGNGTESIVAQFPDGTHTYDYVPPAGTKSIDGGNWLREPISGPTGNLPPSDYLSLRVIPVTANVTPATLVFGRSFYPHSGNGTPGTGTWDSTGHPTRAPETSDPRYYLDNRAALWPVRGGDGTHLRPVNIYRTPDGIGWQIYDPTLTTYCGSYGQYNDCPQVPTTRPPDVPWTGVPGYFGGPPAPLGDKASPSCVPENFSCFGSDPSRYETLRVANDLRGPGDNDGYVLGRLSNGLHVYASSDGSGWDSSIPVLTALKDPSGQTAPPGEWSSIRTGDVTGDGRTDVLALVDGQLKAWELKPNGSGGWAWNELATDVSLNLGQSFEDNASYYSTIRVGPIAGPGYPDGVIARGPFGIRTWFYCTGRSSPVPGCASLRGKSGWTSWRPQPIPQASGHPAVPAYPEFAGGQATAWTELNTLARQAQLISSNPASTIRDVWTGATAPTDNTLSQLRSGLLLFAGCSVPKSANPTTYQTCTAPAGSGIATPDWTAVVNEALTEIFDAGQANDFFGQLATLNSDTFLAKEAELPAISSSVAALGQAAGNNGTQVSLQSLFSTGFGIAGATAGILNPVAGAALGIASYIAAFIPSATPDVTGPTFNSTLNQLQNHLANAVTDAFKAVDAQSYEVRLNYSMLQLVTALTGPSGPWHAINAAGLQGSMDEGFALWAYKQLLPTMLDRYVITGCRGESESSPDNTDCFWSKFTGGIGSPPDFTYLEGAHSTGQNPASGWPCWADWSWICHYNAAPTSTVNGEAGTDIATKVWGPLSDTCNFNGDPHTEWTFGCNLGVSPQASTDAIGGLANGWNFTTCTASPRLFLQNGTPSSDEYGSCSSSTSGVASTGPNGGLRLTAAVGLPRSFDVHGATLTANRLLYEPDGRGALLTRSTGRSLGTVRLTTAGGKLRGGPGGNMLGSPRGTPPMTLALQRPRYGQPRLTLSLSRLGVAVPDACQQLPASVSMATPPFTLQAALQISDGHATHTVSLPAEWRCVRNRGGAVTGLRTVAPPTPARHPGLAVSIAGPRAVVPGSVAVYTVRVQNTRRGPRNPRLSALWNVLVQTSVGRPASLKSVKIRVAPPVVRHVAELARRRTKLLRVPVEIPGDLAGTSVHRICVATGATTYSTRAAGAEACSAVVVPPLGRG